MLQYKAAHVHLLPVTVLIVPTQLLPLFFQLVTQLHQTLCLLHIPLDPHLFSLINQTVNLFC